MNNSFTKLRIWCFIGLLLSVYTTYVELKSENDKKYVAMCDLSEKISCTAVFSSAYGRGFGLLQYITGDAESIWNPPNGVLGVIFYTLILISTTLHKRLVSLLRIFACFLSNLLSIYLAYLLYFVLDDLCVVCVSIYVVNWFCLFESWRAYRKLWCAKEKSLTETRVNVIDKNK